MAAIAFAIVAGSGNDRTSMARLDRTAFRLARPLDTGGHGSTGSTSRSTARLMHARDTLRYREAVEAARGGP